MQMTEKNNIFSTTIINGPYKIKVHFHSNVCVIDGECNRITSQYVLILQKFCINLFITYFVFNILL